MKKLSILIITLFLVFKVGSLYASLEKETEKLCVEYSEPREVCGRQNVCKLMCAAAAGATIGGVATTGTGTVLVGITIAVAVEYCSQKCSNIPDCITVKDCNKFKYQ